MKLEKLQKIALATIGFVAIQSAVIWLSYSLGSNEGFREGRSGYMKKPIEGGTITINSKGEPEFKPFPSTPYFLKSRPWNSKENRIYMEHQLKNNMATTQFGRQVRTQVASVRCSATQTTNLWHCVFRVLGSSADQSSNFEVNPETGDWRGAS